MKKCNRFYNVNFSMTSKKRFSDTSEMEALDENLSFMIS